MNFNYFLMIFFFIFLLGISVNAAEDSEIWGYLNIEYKMNSILKFKLKPGIYFDEDCSNHNASNTLGQL